MVEGGGTGLITIGELRSHMLWGNSAWELQLLSSDPTTREKPTHHNKRSHMMQLRSQGLQLRPNAAKDKINKNFYKITME